tara:strand:+ start:1246 stop:1548 length:303 start_codon:yes stop_codon:yes gene_type:complete
MNKEIEEEQICSCCPVHTTWRERPIPKREVTIEMIAELNKLYRSLHAEFHNYLQGEHGDRYYEHSDKNLPLKDRIDEIDKILLEYKMFRSIEKLKEMGEL